MLKKITTDSTIAVIAPAFPPKADKTKKGITYLKNRGFKIIESATLSGNFGYLSAPDELRAQEINACFADDNIDAIFCARGGWGTLRMLDKLDYETIKNNPKLLVGYSDITSLQMAIWHKSKVPAISGPMVSVEMGTGILKFTEKHFWQQIENKDEIYKIDLDHLENIQYMNEGQCSGIILGGCLSLLAHQLGTPYSPDYFNAILFIEDVGEKPYKIDRYLAQLKQAGIFNLISGLIVGEFIDCEDDAPSFSIKEIVNQYTAQCDFPVIYNFPYGHAAKKISLPIGVWANLDTPNKFLEFANPFF